MPVGRQAGAGGFVWQEEGPWKLRNKARDRAGWGCRPAGQIGQGWDASGGSGPYVSGQPLFSPAHPGYFWLPRTVGPALSRIRQVLLDLQALMVVQWFPKYLFKNEVGKMWSPGHRIQEERKKR